MRLFQAYRNFIFDCDGVLWHSWNTIGQSQYMVRKLIETGKNVVFVTNNSTKSRKSYREKFAKLGFGDIHENFINTSSSMAAEVCAQRNYKKVFVIGEQGLREELKLKSIEPVCDISTARVTEEEFLSMPLDREVRAVVVGWDRDFNYRKLCLASLYLQSGASLISTNPDVFDKVGGKKMPGNGCMVSAIQHSVDDPHGTKTITTGKPNVDFFHRIMDKYDFNPSETIMVGDRVDTDVQFTDGHIDSLLVLTGCTTRQDLEHIPHHFVRPTYVAEDLSTGLDLIVSPVSSSRQSAA